MARSTEHTTHHVVDDVMTLPQAADFLRIGGATLRRAALAKTVPATRTGLRWRFSRVALQTWLCDTAPTPPSVGKHRRAGRGDPDT